MDDGLAREWQKKIFEAPEPEKVSTIVAILTAATVFCVLVTTRPPFLEGNASKPFLRKSLNMPLAIAISIALASVVYFIDASWV